MSQASHRLQLTLLPIELAVCRLEPAAAMPAWGTMSMLYALIHTPDELTVVCAATAVPAGVRCQAGWRAFQVCGPLDFALTGVLAALAVPLAAAGVSIFAISTFDTDYVLVPADKLSAALEALVAAGHTIQ